MTRQVIPIRNGNDSLLFPQLIGPSSSTNWRDQFSRPLHDLRISVTDRCNFRCVYCMPKEVFDSNYPYLNRSDILDFEEILRIAKIFAAQGGRKIRLTGGEPLLRKNLVELVRELSYLKSSDGRNLNLSLTTNGVLLSKMASPLKDAGLDRVTVSLDALDEYRFKQMSDSDFNVEQILAGIDAAMNAGLGPIKVNMVVKAGVNEDQIIPMVEHFRHTSVVLRFIEFMDVGNTNEWSNHSVLPSEEILNRITSAGYRLELLPASAEGETATRWRYLDGGGEIGFVSSITHAFCGECTRARLSTDGKIYTCLFASSGYDVRDLLRNPSIDDERLAVHLASLWFARKDRYSAERQALLEAGIQKNKIEMSYIGG